MLGINGAWSSRLVHDIPRTYPLFQTKLDAFFRGGNLNACLLYSLTMLFQVALAFCSVLASCDILLFSKNLSTLCTQILMQSPVIQSERVLA